jgi:hypothetical protein
MYQTNFFGWYRHTEQLSKSSRIFEENIYTLMELMKLGWSDIMCMPYPAFIHALKWKTELEKERRKKMDERLDQMKSKKSNKHIDVIKSLRKQKR